MIRAVLDSRYRLRGLVTADVEAEICAMCTHANPAYKQLERLARTRKKLRFALRKEPKTIATWERDGGGLAVPRGCRSAVDRLLVSRGVALTVLDRRTEGTGERWPGVVEFRPDPDAPDGGAMRWYQEEGIAAMIAGESGFVRAPTGSGKTVMGIALHARLNVPTLVIVWTTALRDQWISRAAKGLGVPEYEIGVVGGGQHRCGPLTIGMLQTLRGGVSDEFLRYFGAVIVDEVQYAPRGVLDIVGRFPARYRIGISADHTRPDGLESLTEDVFGPVLHEVSRDELIDDGSVLDVECRLVPTDFAADWYVEQREEGGMPDHSRLLDELGADAERNGIVVALVDEEVKAGNQVLVYSHRVEHCRRLDTQIESAGIRCGLMIGGSEWKGRYEEARGGIETGSLRAACGTVQAVGTGIDLPSLSRGILTMPVGNNRQLYQQIRGRQCRKGKEDAALYVLWDRAVSGVKTLRNMIAWNRRVTVRTRHGWVDGREYLKHGGD